MFDVTVERYSDRGGTFSSLLWKPFRLLAIFDLVDRYILLNPPHYVNGDVNKIYLYLPVQGPFKLCAHNKMEQIQCSLSDYKAATRVNKYIDYNMLLPGDLSIHRKKQHA